MRGVVGAVLVAGVLAGCGGVAPEAETQELSQQSQAVNPSCKPGYTETLEWECPYFSTPTSPCFYVGWANQQHLYCSNGSDQYDADPYGRVVCGECY